jgi:hypothetical protein
VVETTSLENWHAARYRGFESHPLRQINIAAKKAAEKSLSKVEHFINK